VITCNDSFCRSRRFHNHCLHTYSIRLCLLADIGQCLLMPAVQSTMCNHNTQSHTSEGAPTGCSHGEHRRVGSRRVGAACCRACVARDQQMMSMIIMRATQHNDSTRGAEPYACASIFKSARARPHLLHDCVRFLQQHPRRGEDMAQHWVVLPQTLRLP
jgi:hypothetical protein